MAFTDNPILDLLVFDLYQSYLPDFLIAFAFFTAVIYGVMGKRLGAGRPAVAVSAAMGLALSIGLVWWEYEKGITIRQLGPIAVGFALLLLAGVLYQAIKNIGGGWAGAALALGVCILIGWLAGLNWSIDTRVVQSITTALLTVGILAFLLHRHGALLTTGRAGRPVNRPNTAEFADIHHDMSDLEEDKNAANWLDKGFRNLKNKARSLDERPQDAGNIMVQLQRMLPAEGYLTQRLARLREKAHRIRVGHIARIDELQKAIAHMPAIARRQAGSELAAMYKRLKFDTRIERLERAVAANENRVRELTQQAQDLLQRQDHRGLVSVLDQATKLQKHNASLLRNLAQTEKRLLAAAAEVARKSGPARSR